MRLCSTFFLSLLLSAVLSGAVPGENQDDHADYLNILESSLSSSFSSSLPPLPLPFPSPPSSPPYSPYSTLSFSFEKPDTFHKKSVEGEFPQENDSYPLEPLFEDQARGLNLEISHGLIMERNNLENFSSFFNDLEVQAITPIKVSNDSGLIFNQENVEQVKFSQTDSEDSKLVPPPLSNPPNAFDDSNPNPPRCAPPMKVNDTIKQRGGIPTGGSSSGKHLKVRTSERIQKSTGIYMLIGKLAKFAGPNPERLSQLEILEAVIKRLDEMEIELNRLENLLKKRSRRKSTVIMLKEEEEDNFAVKLNDNDSPGNIEGELKKGEGKVFECYQMGGGLQQPVPDSSLAEKVLLAKVPNPVDAIRLLDLQELDYIERFLTTLSPLDYNEMEEDNKDESSNDLCRRRPMDEQEKRVRHVASEHKRRNRIKDELARMSKLVPNAKKTKVRNSQAKILGQANDYIEQLKDENERLRMLIARMTCPSIKL